MLVIRDERGCGTVREGVVDVYGAARARGNEEVNVTAAKLSADKRTVTLTIEDLRPCHQQHIRFNITAADGTKINSEVMHTIHAVK